MNEAFVTRKWNIVNDNSRSNYDATNETSYNTEILKSNLCDYSNTYILVTGDITVVAAPATKVAFNNCAPFTKCIKKNILKQQQIYGLILKMKQTNLNANIANEDNFKSFKYKAKLLRNIVDQPAPNAANEILKNIIKILQ